MTYFLIHITKTSDGTEVSEMLGYATNLDTAIEVLHSKMAYDINQGCIECSCAILDNFCNIVKKDTFFRNIAE